MANLINEINTARILRRLWHEGETTRVDLARDLGLSKSTVTGIVNALVPGGLVRELATGPSGPRGGRPPQLIEINPRFGCILGLEIQTESCKAVATDFRGELVFSDSQPLAPGKGRMRDIFARAVERFLPKVEETGLELRGVGLGLAGIIDPRGGRIIQSNPLGIAEPENFYEEVAGLLEVPVAVENDANCCCWGELAFHKGRRRGNFAFVLGEFRRGRTGGAGYWGPAVGLGFVLDGQVRHGAGYSAGEFKSLDWREGNSGQFALGDEESARVLHDAEIRLAVIRELCAHVAFLVNTLNLNQVVFGGELAGYREEIAAELGAQIARNWSYRDEVDCGVEFSALGDYAVAYGAAGMFLERFFTVPGSEPGPQPGGAALPGAGGAA